MRCRRLVVELAKLLAFCWETGVASVYYESLGDHPSKHGEYMGLFDKWGVPKLSYSYLRLVQSVSRHTFATALQFWVGPGNTLKKL